mmetsp:Transcript_16711/g.25106  ORF Transcript_16711/g.25106 Transcript_16711/m.25106 type:complete len:311 (-) Transcript_16711:242-1174(-)
MQGKIVPTSPLTTSNISSTTPIMSNNRQSNEQHSLYLTLAHLMSSKKDRHEIDMNNLSTWSTQRVLRWVTCSTDDAHINEIMFTYANTIELLASRYPQWSTQERVDWAIAKALSPEWFDDHLTTRMNNSMLISALLITVSAALYFVPPQLDIVDGVSVSSNNLRVFYYLTSFADLFFMMSIICGVCFIENALSRAYCDADKFVLIIEQYAYKNISQVTAVIGALLFVVSLFVPMWLTYSEDDCIVMTIIGGLIFIWMAYVQIVTANQASLEQSIRTEKFLRIVDQTDGRLLPQYYPKECCSQEELGELYV